jgi:hypothetical protein
LEEKVAAPVYKGENMAIGIHYADHRHPQKIGTNLADKRQQLIGIALSLTQGHSLVLVFR